MVDSVMGLRGRVCRRVAGDAETAPPDARSVLAGLQLARGHLAAALIALQLEDDLLAFVQRAEARALDGGDVHEDVVAAVVGLDEAEALGGVEPLHGAGSHVLSLSSLGFTRPDGP